MGQVFQRTYRDKTGAIRQCARWTIRYFVDGRPVQEATKSTSRRFAEARLARLEALEAKRRDIAAWRAGVSNRPKARRSGFGVSQTTEAKRQVRAMYWEEARACLRARDGRHHAEWKVLILAGHNPQEEVSLIRNLMPQARITAVDRDPECLAKAIDAGVDDVVYCDLAMFDRKRGRPVPHPELSGARFDVVALDLCGPATWIAREIVQTYSGSQSLEPGGVLIVTFSLGRDVVEEIQCSGLPFWKNRVCGSRRPSEGLLMRINHVLASRPVRSIRQYRGNQMWMCSVLSWSWHPHTAPIVFERISAGDQMERVAC